MNNRDSDVRDLLNLLILAKEQINYSIDLFGESSDNINILNQIFITYKLLKKLHFIILEYYIINNIEQIIKEEYNQDIEKIIKLLSNYLVN